MIIVRYKRKISGGFVKSCLFKSSSEERDPSRNGIQGHQSKPGGDLLQWGGQEGQNCFRDQLPILALESARGP